LKRHEETPFPYAHPSVRKRKRPEYGTDFDGNQSSRPKLNPDYCFLECESIYSEKLFCPEHWDSWFHRNVGKYIYQLRRRPISDIVIFIAIAMITSNLMN
jgi:hypothetical protein